MHIENVQIENVQKILRNMINIWLLLCISKLKSTVLKIFNIKIYKLLSS